MIRSLHRNWICIRTRYVRKAVGAINIKKITSEDIEKFYEELVIRDRIVINVLESLDGLLQVLFSTAMKSEYITSDPSQGVLERVMVTFNWKKPRRHILTERQYSAFTKFILSEDNVMFAEWVPLLTAMVGTGCRTEELLALSWSDVDAENDILRIQHKIQYRDRNHVTNFKILPARFGGREVPLIHAVQDALCKERDRQLKLGVSGSEFEIEGKSGFVFLNYKGHVHTPSAVNQQLKKVTGLYNNRERYRASQEGREPVLLPDVTSHNLPYTIAEELRQAEHDPVIAQKLDVYQGQMAQFQQRYSSGA